MMGWVDKRDLALLPGVQGVSEWAVASKSSGAVAQHGILLWSSHPAWHCLNTLLCDTGVLTTPLPHL